LNLSAIYGADRTKMMMHWSQMDWNENQLHSCVAHNTTMYKYWYDRICWNTKCYT